MYQGLGDSVKARLVRYATVPKASSLRLSASSCDEQFPALPHEGAPCFRGLRGGIDAAEIPEHLVE